MGTYAYALFSHSGVAREVEAVCRRLVAAHGFSWQAEAVDPAAALEREWARKRSFLLDWEHGLLHLHPRAGALYHVEVRWWAFAQDGRMNNGLGREAVRERSRPIARLFGGDRILYVPETDGMNAIVDGRPLADEEAEMRRCSGPPQDWDAPPPSDDEFRARWFLELI